MMSGGDNMTQGNAITLYGLERKNNDRICELCEAARPREMLAQIQSSGFDCEILKKRVYIREACPMPVHPWRQPFLTACGHRNYPVVRLFLELGADPDAECRGWSHETPRQEYANNPQLQELFEGGKLWWKVEYPDEKKRMLQGEFEHCIMAGEASETVWHMTHGMHLHSPVILAGEAFAKQPRAFKELVCGMGVPNDRLQEFHAWLEQNASDADLLDIMETLSRRNGDGGRAFVENLFLSIDLLGADRLDSLIEHSFPLPVQINVLQAFISAYDTCEHQPFVEKAITALFRGMLYSYMDV